MSLLSTNLYNIQHFFSVKWPLLPGQLTFVTLTTACLYCEHTPLAPRGCRHHRLARKLSAQLGHLLQHGLIRFNIASSEHELPGAASEHVCRLCESRDQINRHCLEKWCPMCLDNITRRWSYCNMSRLFMQTTRALCALTQWGGVGPLWRVNKPNGLQKRNLIAAARCATRVNTAAYIQRIYILTACLKKWQQLLRRGPSLSSASEISLCHLLRVCLGFRFLHVKHCRTHGGSVWVLIHGFGVSAWANKRVAWRYKCADEAFLKRYHVSRTTWMLWI